MRNLEGTTRGGQHGFQLCVKSKKCLGLLPSVTFGLIKLSKGL